jgi:hypothetical protein
MISPGSNSLHEADFVSFKPVMSTPFDHVGVLDVIPGASFEMGLGDQVLVHVINIVPSIQ